MIKIYQLDKVPVFYGTIGRASLDLLYIIPSDISKCRAYDIKGSIVTGRKANQFNDKPCYHYNCDGVVIPRLHSQIRETFSRVTFGETGRIYSEDRTYAFQCVTVNNCWLYYQYFFSSSLQYWLITSATWIGLYNNGNYSSHQFNETYLRFRDEDEVDSYLYNWARIETIGEDFTLTPSKVSTTIFNRTLSNTSDDVLQCASSIASFLNEPTHLYRPNLDSKIGPGDLGLQCAENTRCVTINSLAYVNDLKNLVSEVRDIISLARGNVSAKTLSSAFLEYKYGLRLTTSDTTELVSALLTDIKSVYGVDGHSVTKARYTSTTSQGYSLEEHLKIYFDPKDDLTKSLLRFLDEWDALPTRENVWDLIPFSFVVDWFTGIGDLLQQADNEDRLSRLDILSSVYSTKLIVPVTWSTQDYGSFQLSLVYYERQILDTLPAPTFQLPSTDGLFNHWLEATALLVSNKK